ncbi:MAG: hypothetical protein LCH57_01970 [Proteobacteria bacterium]|nr:hypothetical protein [Pseudomonadota bacterium]
MPHLLPAAASAIAQAAPAAAATAAKATVMGTLKSVAFNALTSLAISSALSVFSPSVGASARQVEFVIDPDGPIPFAAGRVGVSGSVVHRDTFGPDLMYYGIPFVLSGAGPITAIESFMADDYPMAFDANGGATTEPYRQELFFRSVLGFQPAPAALTTPGGLKKGATLPGWTSAHKLSGKAAGLIVMAENSKGSAFPTGEIKPLVQLLGLKGWDPTQDSTYPGGSGPCRLHDASTWVTLTCPILWALKWALGLWEGPTLKGAPAHDSLTDHQVGGIGARLSGIDVPAFVAASNVAKANGWTVSAYPNTDDDKHQVLETFLQSGGATYAQRAGKISCISRAAPRASLVTISARDTAGPLEIDTAASRIDRINTLRPRFWSPAHRWQMTAMDGEITAQAYRDEDGGRTRSRGVDFPFVSDAKQTGQLAALQIANTREGIAGVIPLKPHLQRIRPGDAFTITEAGFVLNGLKCLCLNTDYDPATGVVRVSFVSETDAKYPFALGQNPTPPVPQVLTPVDPRFVNPPDNGDWTISPRPPASGGGQLPGFDLTGIVSNETATAIIVETGPTADGPWTQAYQGPPTVTNIPVDGLQPGATYYVAIQYQRNQNYSERQVYGPFTAPALVAEDLSPNSPVVQQIGDILTDVEGLIETYGSTEAAAVSAAAADTARALAQAAEAGALQERQQAHAEAVAAQAAREGSESAAASSVSSAQTASAEADEAGQKAAAAEVARAAAATQRALAEAARNTAVGAADTATGASASAGASATLAARLGFGQAMNPNPVFSQTWATGQIPPGWTDWSSLSGTDNKRVGVESDNGVFMTVPGSGTAESANRGLYQPSGVGSLGTVQAGGWYVQELTVRLESGTLNGAGMHLQHYDGAGNIVGSTNINCASDQTVTGGAPGAGVVGQVYRYAVLIQATAGTKIFVPYAMAFWNGYYGAAPVAKSVTFTKCLVRPATAGEIETGVARNGFGTIHARMTNEETVRASETASLSVRQGVLEAKATTLPNLLRNSDGSQGMRYWTSGGAGALWTTFYDAAFGSIFGALGGNNGDTFYLISDLVRVYGNSTYTLSWNGDGGAAPGDVGIYCAQYDVNGAYIPEGDSLGLASFQGVNWTTRKSTTFTTRADCVYLKVVVVKPGYANGNPLNAFVSRIMLNAGATVAGWTDAATARDLAARTVSNEGALATVQGRQTAWAQKRVIAGSAEAFAEMMALDDNGNVTSDINFGAKALGFWNSLSGLFVKAMEIVGGSVFITGKLFMGLAKQITLDPTIPALIFTPHSGASKMIYGAGFGSSSDCLMWLGPKDTDISDITRINGGWAFGTDGKAYFGNAELSTGGGFRASSNVLSVSGDRVGAGSVTTDAVTISATGGGAPITYAWTQVSGDFGAWTILSPSSASTQFRTVVSTPGTGRLASFACRVTDASGRVDTVIVPAAVIAEVDGGGGA